MAEYSEGAARNKRGIGRPFKKGVSGNPSGRPKVDPEVKEILKAAAPEAARRLVELMSSTTEKISLQACMAILDRVLGKPEATSKIELNGAEAPKIIFSWKNTERNI